MQLKTRPSAANAAHVTVTAVTAANATEKHVLTAKNRKPMTLSQAFLLLPMWLLRTALRPALTLSVPSKLPTLQQQPTRLPCKPRLQRHKRLHLHTPPQLH